MMAPTVPIRDAEGDFIGMGRVVTIIEKEALYGHKRPDSFTKKENWLERQLKGRRHLLVPIKDIEFEPRSSAPRKLLSGKEELQKYEEVWI